MQPPSQQEDGKTLVPSPAHDARAENSSAENSTQDNSTQDNSTDGESTPQESNPPDPAESPAADPTSTQPNLTRTEDWCVLGASVCGASHVRSGKPNQDAIGWLVRGQTVFIALADGHGSARYIRSHEGARLAVETALAELERFFTQHKDEPAIKRLAEEQLPRTLVRSWQDAILHRLEQSPPTPAELETLARLDSGTDPLATIEDRPQRIFGATLLAAILTPQFGLFLQLGDGDIVTVGGPDAVERLPLAHDDRLIANQTTSLAGTKAWQDMRVYFQPYIESPPALILFSTDGYANSFQDDTGFLVAAADFQTLYAQEGPGCIQESLVEWLTQTSEVGSGDDISVGLVAYVPHNANHLGDSNLESR